MSRTSQYIEEGEPIEVDGDRPVTLRKIITRKGERIEVRSQNLGTAILISPLNFESLTWIDSDTLADLVLESEVDREGYDGTATTQEGDHDTVESSLTIANEFTQVTVSKLRTARGDRVKIQSDKLGYTNLLGPIELEVITEQDRHVFSEFLSQPLGPDPQH